MNNKLRLVGMILNNGVFPENIELDLYTKIVSRINRQIKEDADTVFKRVKKVLKTHHSVDRKANWSDVLEIVEDEVSLLGTDDDKKDQAEKLAWDWLETNYPRRKEACWLVVRIGLSRKEAAAEMGISPTGIRTHLWEGIPIWEERVEYYIKELNEGRSSP